MKPAILKVLAITGVGVTTALAIKAAPKAYDYYEEMIVSDNFGYTNDNGQSNKVIFAKKMVRLWAPTALSAGATVLSILMLDKSHTKIEEALLGSLYLAKTQVQAIKDEYDVEYDFKGAKLPKINRKDQIIVWEPYTDQMITTTEAIIDRAMNRVNKRLNQFYTVRLNRFIKDIGGRECSFGDVIGWSCDNQSQMDIWNGWGEGPYTAAKLAPYETDDGRKVYVIDYDVNPLWVKGF